MASGLFQSLLNRLNSVFNKDPQVLSAFQILPPSQCKMVIANRTLIITAVGNFAPIFSISLDHPYDAAKSISIKDLYTALQSTKLFTVQNINLALSGLGASALVEGEFDLYATTFNNVMAATSVLWGILKPLAYILEQSKNDVDFAIQQLGFVTAQGEFLDYWGTIFNINRYPAEPDYEYSIRLLWETIKPRLNNKALENIVKQGVGYDNHVVDLSSKIMLTDGFDNPTHLGDNLRFTDPLMITDSELSNTSMGTPDDTVRYTYGERYSLGSFGVYVDVPIASAYYSYTTTQLQDLLERHRAAGTTPWFIVNQVANEVRTLLNSVIYQLEQSIAQQVNEDRAMFFGHDDFTFYTDHWRAENIQKMPWNQNHLEIPSLCDNVVLAQQAIEVPAPSARSLDTFVTAGFVTDGFNGGFNTNVCRTDGSGNTDTYDGLVHVATEFPIGNPNVVYVYSPVILNYKRYLDEAIIPRIVEGFNDDVMSKTTSTITGTVTAWTGPNDKTNVSKSNDVVFTTPLQIIGPASITGVKFDEIRLREANINNVPVVIRNLEIPDFGNNWANDYPATRRWLVPYQDTCGNRYYHEIEWPIYSPPPAIALRISNPTADIGATGVQVVTGGSININWTVTQSASADIQTVILSTGTTTDTAVAFTGSITYNNITQSTRYTITGVGNNGQIAQASITVSVVAVPLVASAPTITLSAFPDKCLLCANKTSVITYSVEFNSKQTENQTVTYPLNASSFTLIPLGPDPAGTMIISSRVPTVSRLTDGFVIQGGWSGLDAPVTVFTPLNPAEASGYSLVYNYDVNYGGSTLFFNENQITLPNQAALYQIEQQVTVDLPPPPAPTTSTYSVNYAVRATNYASTSTKSIPIYISPIQQGSGTFAVTGISPSSLVEAIGNTANETVPITLTGKGFSSKMDVYLLKPYYAPDMPQVGGGVKQFQYVQASITNLDWQNGSLTFIAPQFQFGIYTVVVNIIDCLGSVVSTDKSQVLTYNASTYRHPPFITDLNPKTVCISGGFTSAPVTIMGYNFRTGAAVYMLMPNGTLAAKTTRFINERALSFDMDVSTLGAYDLMVINTDTSSGVTNHQPLKVMSSATFPTIDQFGYTFPQGPGGCAQYGANFNIYWSCSSTSYVTFTSNDSKVQQILVSPDQNGWPAKGSVSVPIFTKGTTVTMTARNDCNNSVLQTKTFTQEPCDLVLGISIVPSKVIFTSRKPLLVHSFRNDRLATGVGTFTDTSYDITSDSATVYQLVSDQVTAPTSTSACVTLTDKTLMPNINGATKLQVLWNGYTATAEVFVQLPVPIALTASPDLIEFTNINQPFPLTIIATYSDGTTKDVTLTCRYTDFDPTIVSVSSSGLVLTKQIGRTTIRCAYVDKTVDPSVYVYTTIPVGVQDGCVGFDRLWTEPAYGLDTAPVTNVRWVITGANGQQHNILTDNGGTASLTYTGFNEGLDTVQAFIDEFNVSSNQAVVSWLNLNALIGLTPVTGQFFFSDGKGVFNTPGGTIPAFTQTFNSLAFNTPLQSLILGYPFAAGDQSRPMQNAILNSNGGLISVQSVQDSKYQAGKFPLKYFNAVFTGNFVVKQAGNLTFNIWADDGYVFGIGNGANRVSGDYSGAPGDGLTAFNQYPIMGARNVDGLSGFSTIVVQFPSSGIYPFEIGYSEGTGDHYAFYVSVDEIRGTIAPVSITLPTALPQSPATSPVNIQITPIVSGPDFTGNTQTLIASVTGLTRNPVKLHIDAHSIRTAMVNNVAILNESLLDTWSYQTSEILSSSKAYRVTIANSSSTVTATAFANLISFPVAQINNFSCYQAISNSPLSGGPITVNYGEPVGFVWNTQFATSVQLYDVAHNIVRNLPASGSLYVLPLTSGDFRLTVMGVDGSSIQQTINVQLANQFNTQIGNSADLVRLGQTSTLTPISGIDSASLSGTNDLFISTTGIQPGISPAFDIAINSDLSAVVSPSTNSFYHYQLQSSYQDCVAVDPDFNALDISEGYLFVTRGSRSVGSRTEDCQTIVSTLDLYACVNVDPGPNFVSLVASPARVNVGEPVTISYNATGAVSVTGDFIGGKNIPTGSGSFKIYPDQSTNFTFTATSSTGIVTQATVHVAVNSQQYSAICSGLLPPAINNIAIDGVISGNGIVASCNEDEAIRVLEIFGDHLLGDRTSTPELIGRVQVLISANGAAANTITGLELVELSAVSNTYIRVKIRTHVYTLAGRYSVAVMNDVGISNTRGINSTFNVNVRVPDLIMNTPISGVQGGAYDFYVDFVDPLRDVGLGILVDGVKVTPISIGSNLSNSDFVTGLYQQVLIRKPSTVELNSAVLNLENSQRRRTLMDTLLVSAEYQQKGISAIVALGTKVRAIVDSSVSVGITIVTDNGVGNTSIPFVSEPAPPAPPSNINTCPVITGVSPTQGQSGTVVNVFGQNFTGGCTIKLGNQVVAPTFVNSNNLRFTVPATAQSSQSTITVNNGTCSDVYQYFYWVLGTVQTDPTASDTALKAGDNITLMGSTTTGDYSQLLDRTDNTALTNTSNTAVRGNYIDQPSVVVGIQGLGAITPSTVLPVPGSYQPAASMLFPSIVTIVTLMINEVVLSEPNVIKLGLVEHNDLRGELLQ
jgi:hypothetical protein